jgi:hypothetical protein
LEEQLKLDFDPKNLRQRMYSLVLYNMSPIQQGIQTAHSIVEYAQAYFQTLEYQRWAQVDKTVIILNGGSSIKLKEHIDYLIDNQIVDLAFFKEPDLYNGITSVCFLADERIWDRETYPDRLNELEGHELPGGGMIIPAIHRVFDINAFKERIGGEKNFLLKEFLSKFRTA